MGTLTSTDATEAGPRSWGESRCVQEQVRGPTSSRPLGLRETARLECSDCSPENLFYELPHPMTQQYTRFYLFVFLAASRRREDAAYTDTHTEKSALERKGQIEMCNVQKDVQCPWGGTAGSSQYHSFEDTQEK